MPVVAIHHTLKGFARRATRKCRDKDAQNEKQTDYCQRKVRLKQPVTHSGGTDRRRLPGKSDNNPVISSSGNKTIHHANIGRLL